MATSVRTGNFTLQAMTNGVTLDVEVRLLTSGTSDLNFLWQYFTQSGSVTPDYENGSKHPRFYARAKNVATGDVYEATDVKLFWNGTEVSFPTGGGLSTGTWAGYFRKTEGVSVDGKQQTVFEIVKNIASAGTNEDADSFYLTGTVSTGNNNTQQFTSAVQTFEVYKQSESATEDYRVVMTVTDIEQEGDTGLIQAQLFSVAAGDFVTGITAEWFNLDGTTETKVTSADTGYKTHGGGTAESVVSLEIDPDRITGEDTYRVKIKRTADTTNEYVGTAYIQDFSDGFVVQCVVTGDVDNGYAVRQGGTATVAVRCVKADGSGTVVNPGKYANLALYRNDGTSAVVASTDYTYANPSANGQGTLTMTYDQLTNNGGTVIGFITIDDTKK